MRVLTKFALLALVLVTSWSFGRQPAQDQVKQGKSEAAAATLEELLNTALENNPDVQVAEAKLHEVEAELRRTRLNLASQVIALHAKVIAQKELLKVSQEEFTMYARLHKSGQ